MMPATCIGTTRIFLAVLFFDSLADSVLLPYIDSRGRTRYLVRSSGYWLEVKAMKDKRSLHLKVQELCDCFVSEDPLRAMSLLKKDADKEEAALKWFALAVLHGVNDNAKRIVLERSKDGSVEVSAKYRKATLPAPDPDTASRVMEALRAILHTEGEKGDTDLALGIRDSRLDLHVKLESAEGKDALILEFPK